MQVWFEHLTSPRLSNIHTSYMHACIYMYNILLFFWKEDLSLSGSHDAHGSLGFIFNQALLWFILENALSPQNLPEGYVVLGPWIQINNWKTHCELCIALKTGFIPFLRRYLGKRSHFLFFLVNYLIDRSKYVSVLLLKDIRIFFCF